MDKKQQLQDLISKIDGYVQKKNGVQSNKQDFEDIKQLLKTLITTFKEFKIDIPKEITVPAPKVTVQAPQVKIPAPIVNVPKAQPIVNVVERDYSESINKELKKVQKLLESVKIDTTAKNPLAVRLTDGEGFYKALETVVTQAIQGGGSSVPTVKSELPGIRGVPVVNPDGSNIAGGSGSSAYSDSGNTDKKGLVDADRHVQVDVLTMPGVTVDTTGLATSAKQDTIIGHVDGIEGLLTTIDTDTGTLSGAVTAGKVQTEVTNTVAVTGSFYQATQPVSGTVTANIGTGSKVRLTDGTTDAEVVPLTGYNAQAVAIVDGSGNQITSFGGGTQYTEGDTDATITGTAMLFESNTGTSALSVVSNSSPLPISDAGGAITVDGTVGVSGTVAVTQSGTWDEVGINDSGNSITVDAPVATPVFVRLSDGASAISTLPVSLSSVPSHAVTNAGTFAVQVDGSALTSLQLIDDAVATTASTIPTKGLAISGTDGTNARVVKTDTSGELQVDVLTMPTTTVTGTVAATQSGSWSVTNLANSGVDIGDVTINNASGASAVNIQDGGNTITVDGTVTVGSITAGDNNIGNVDVVTLPATPAGTNAIGKLLPPDIDVTAHTNYARKYYTNAGAVTDGIIWSPASGKRWHIVSLYINVSASATVTLEDDKAGGDDPVFKSEFSANSGVFLTFPEKYPMASGEDTADLLITTSAGNVYVTVVGYEI